MKKIVKSLFICGLVLSTIPINAFAQESDNVNSEWVEPGEEVNSDGVVQQWVEPNVLDDVHSGVSGLAEAFANKGTVSVGVSESFDSLTDSQTGRSFDINKYDYNGKFLFTFNSVRSGLGVSNSYYRVTLSEALDYFNEFGVTNAREREILDDLHVLDTNLTKYNTHLASARNASKNLYGSEDTDATYSIVQAFITDTQDPASNYNLSDIAQYYSITSSNKINNVADFRTEIEKQQGYLTSDISFNGTNIALNSGNVATVVNDTNNVLSSFNGIHYDAGKIEVEVIGNDLSITPVANDGSQTSIEFARGTQVGVDREPTYVYISLDENMPVLVELQGLEYSTNSVTVQLPIIEETTSEETTTEVVTETTEATTETTTDTTTVTQAPVSPTPTVINGGVSNSGGASTPVDNVVTEVTEIVEVIPFEIEYIENPSLPTNEQVIKQEGEDGEKNVVYEVSYKNSNEVGRRKLEETIIKEAKNKIIEVKAKNGIIQETEEEVIPYLSSERENPRLAKGTRQVSTAGVDGKVVITYDVEYQDGRVINKREVSRVISDPINEVIDVGTADMETRVETRVESVPFSVETVNDTQMRKGERKVVQVGVNGSKEATYEVSYTNGSEVGRKLITQKMLTEPVREIVHVGVRDVAVATESNLPETGENNNNLLLGIGFVLLVVGAIGIVFGKRK